MTPFLLTGTAIALVALVAWSVRELGKEARSLADDQKDKARTAGEKEPQEIQQWRSGE